MQKRFWCCWRCIYHCPLKFGRSLKGHPSAGKRTYCNKHKDYLGWFNWCADGEYTEKAKRKGYARKLRNEQ